MRPQAAMAAVLLLMVGSSLFFLRARPERGVSARVNVIERGVPEIIDASGPPAAPLILPASELRLLEEAERSRERLREGSVAASAKALTAKSLPPAAASALVGTPPGQADADADDDAYAAALSLYEAGKFTEAARKFEAVAASKTKKSPMAALFLALSVEKSSGCESALPRYEAVMNGFGKTQAAVDARWGAASCHNELGHHPKAHELYDELRRAPKYRERAEKALELLDAKAP